MESEGSGDARAESASEPTEALPDPTRLQGLDLNLQRMVRALLLYKSFFTGDWYRALLQEEEDPHVVRVLRRIQEETATEAQEALKHTREWNGVPNVEESAARAAAVVAERLVLDMVRLKEASTEVFVAAAMCAPTEEVRQSFMRLADVDRRHVDELRQILGIRMSSEKIAALEGSSERSPAVQVGQFPPGTLTRRLRESLAGVREEGHEPTRVVLSATAFRHLRDEGSLPEADGRFMGYPVDIDFGWGGECFGILTTDRLSAAEIVTRMQHERAARRDR